MTDANASMDWFRYWPYAVALGLGIIGSVLDRRVIGRRVIGALLVLIIVGSQIGMYVSPFTFSGGDYYMESLIAQVAAAVALGGYICAEIWHQMRARTKGEVAK